MSVPVIVPVPEGLFYVPEGGQFGIDDRRDNGLLIAAGLFAAQRTTDHLGIQNERGRNAGNQYCAGLRRVETRGQDVVVADDDGLGQRFD